MYQRLLQSFVRPLSPRANPVPAQPRFTAAAAVPADPPHRPTQFSDLPGELVREIGEAVLFRAGNDQAYDVEALAVTERHRSLLAPELKSNAVLRQLHAADTSAEWLAAVRAMAALPLRHRAHGLLAALRLLPKIDQRVGPGGPVETMWPLLQTLMADLPQHDGEDGTPGRDHLQRALVSALRSAHGMHPGMTILERMLRLIGPEGRPGPALEDALADWTGTLIDRLQPDPDAVAEAAAQLLPVVPRALAPRLQRLFAVAQSVKGNSTAEVEKRLQEWERASNEGQTDIDWHLSAITPYMGLLCSHHPEIRALYQPYFDRLSPERQFALFMRRQSPLAPQDLLPFAQARVGQLPPAVLIALAMRGLDYPLASHRFRSLDFIRQQVQATPDGPQLARALRTALNSAALDDPETRHCLVAAIERLPPAERPAMRLRKSLMLVGCGSVYPNLPGRAAVSARIDELLQPQQPPDAAALEALVDMKVSWLDPAQRCRLIHRLEQLPPERCATLLARAIGWVTDRGLTQTHRPVLDEAIAACRRLEPRYQAPVVAALMNRLATSTQRDNPAAPAQRRALVQIYRALPTALRPHFDVFHALVLQKAEAGPAAAAAGGHQR